MDPKPVPVTASGALLWLVHALLQDNGWLPADCTLPRSLGGDLGVQGFAGDVNLLPQVTYRVGLGDSGEEVAVRALSVGDALFVHFVAAGKSMRLPLKVSEYVKKAEAEREESPAETDRRRLALVGGWLCNRETLTWRLKRNLFPEFPPSGDAAAVEAAPAVSQDAELSRLSDPLIRRIGRFLRGDEFARLAQTSKELHRLHDDRELWEGFIRTEFQGVSLGVADHPKTLYISSWRRRQSRRAPQWWDHHRLGWPDDRFGRPRGPFSWVPPFARPSRLFPRRPLSPVWPFHDDRVRPFGYDFMDDDDDDDIWPVFEPRYSWLQMG